MPRPKSGKAKEVLNCRVPHGLNARISAYADLHSQKVQDVVAEALLKYLEDDHVAPLETDAALVVRQAQQRFTEGMKLINSVLTPRRAPSRSPVASMDAESTATQRLVAGDTWESTDVSGRWRERAFTFDPAKHTWGELCHKQHDRDGGQSVRELANNECVDCRWERSTAYKERKRAAKQSQPVEGVIPLGEAVDAP